MGGAILVMIFFGIIAFVVANMKYGLIGSSIGGFAGATTGILTTVFTDIHHYYSVGLRFETSLDMIGHTILVVGTIIMICAVSFNLLYSLGEGRIKTWR